MRFLQIVAMSVIAASLALSGAASAQSTNTIKGENNATLDQLFTRLKQAKDNGEARKWVSLIWQEWFQTDNADAKRLMARAQFARRADLREEALKVLNMIVQIAPDYVEGWNQRATIYFMLGRDAESIADIRKVLQLEPRHFGALAGLGLIHMRAENWQSAIASFERALELHPFLGEQAFIPKLKEKLKGKAL
jgi:tetratricopeptide (TPR) repeat protein